MPDVRSICAVGRRGQLGLHGQMPWEGERGQEYVADVQRFFDMTRGHVLLMGPRTKSSVPRFAYEDHVAALTAKERRWPESTRRISQLRLTLDYTPQSLIARTLGRDRLHLFPIGVTLPDATLPV